MELSNLGHQVHTTQDEIDLGELFSLIKSSYRFILVMVLSFFLVAVYYVETKKPLYISDAMIEVDNSGDVSNAIALKGLSLGGDSYASPSHVETALLHSPYILSDVVEQLGLDISVKPSAKNKSIPAPHIALLTIPSELLERRLTLISQENNHYSVMSGNTLILNGVAGKLESTSYLSEPFQIKIDHFNAPKGAEFTLIKTPRRNVAEGLAAGLKITEKVRGTGVLQLTYKSTDPVSAQKILNTILTVAVHKNIEKKSKEASKILSSLSEQLPQLATQLSNRETELNQYSAHTGIFDGKTESQSLLTRINSLQMELEKIQLQKMVLLQKFTHAHPDVIALEQKEKSVSQDLQAAKLRLHQIPILGQKALDLKNNVAIQSELYKTVLSSIHKMKMIEDDTISSIEILDHASYPLSPISKKATITLLGSVILGFLMSLAIIFLKFVLMPVVDDPHTIEKTMGLAVSGILPFSRKQKERDKLIKKDEKAALMQSFVLAKESPKDLAVEAIRALRTSIQLALLETDHKVIAITGCSPFAGKSFVSINLAFLMAELGQRVLLIDSDIRLGKIYQSLSTPKTPGLSDYLTNRKSIDQIVQPIIPGEIDFIATGDYPTNPSELISKSAYAELIETAKREYDVVIIDTPPILSVTDASLILRYSTVNLMVLSLGRDKIKQAQYAKSIFEKSGVKLTGIILNMNHERNATHSLMGCYGSYYDRYAYGK